MVMIAHTQFLVSPLVVCRQLLVVYMYHYSRNYPCDSVVHYSYQHRCNCSMHNLSSMNTTDCSRRVVMEEHRQSVGNSLSQHWSPCDRLHRSRRNCHSLFDTVHHLNTHYYMHMFVALADSSRMNGCCLSDRHCHYHVSKCTQRFHFDIVRLLYSCHCSCRQQLVSDLGKLVSDNLWM